LSKYKKRDQRPLFDNSANIAQIEPIVNSGKYLKNLILLKLPPMKFSKKQKKFIKQNYQKLTATQLATQLVVDENHIVAFLKKSGKVAKGIKAARRGDKKPKIKSLQELKKTLLANIPFILLLIALCWLVYANILNNQFVSDDIPGYLEYTPVRTFKGLFGDKTFRLQLIVYTLVYKIFGFTPTPLHVISISIHAYVTVMVFIFAYMTFGKKIAMITALLFATHPINTEAVNWISAINYLFNGALAFTIFNLYTIYKNAVHKKRIHLTIIVVAYMLCAILVRAPWVSTIPIILIIIDQLIIENKVSIKQNIKQVGPFLLATIVYAVFDIAPRVAGRAHYVKNLSHNIGKNLPLTTTVPYTILMTLKLLIVPKDITFYHEGEYLFSYFFAFSKFLILVAPIIIAYLWKQHRKLAGALLIIPASLFPSFSPVQIAWYMAERYTYIGTAFFCMALAYILIYIENKIHTKHLAMIVTVVLVTVYSIKTVARNKKWKTPKDLWLATATVAIDSPRVYNNLGDVYSLEGDYNRALASFKKALEINPRYTEVKHNLGRTYLLMDQLDTAEYYFNTALAQNPNLYQTYYTLGLIEHKRNNNPKAKEYFLKALEINPKYEDAIKAVLFLEKLEKEGTG